ncbi:MAG: hypothetical protein H0W88_04395 [Parachlamydiaceae bacterium]|nr:hypothetical protein [Parachlamydiaceae bacterium]
MSTKVKIIVFFLMFTFFSSLDARQCLHFKRYKKSKITHYAVLSERCTGSNYIDNLIKLNFECPEGVYAFKHFPPWFQLPAESYQGPAEFYSLTGFDNYLFIIIFRSPYDWSRSFHKNPWHCHNSLKHLAFSDFIRTKWDYTFDKGMKGQFAYNNLVDKNPLNGELFKNIFELRSAKIKTMLMLGERAKNVYFINYEAVRDHPKEVKEEIQKIYKLIPKEGFKEVEYYKGMANKGVYVEKKYPPINPEDLIYINSQLDVELERIIGYELIHDAEKID